MPEPEEAIYSRLQADGALTALVGTRIFPGRIPQGELFDATGMPQPVCAFQRITSERFKNSVADADVRSALFQVGGWSDVYETANAIRTAARNSLDRWKGTVAGVVIQASFIEDEQDLYDEPAELHHHVVEVAVWYE